VNPAESSLPLPVPLSAARVRGELIYTSGQVGTDPQTRRVPGDLEQEMRRAMDNLGRALADAGGTYSTVVKTTVFIARQEDFALMNEVYRDYFASPYPARTTITTELADPRYRFEIEAVAYTSASAEPLRPRVDAEARNIPAARHYRWDDMPKDELNPLLHRRLISTERMMLAHVYLEPGCIVPKHSHENEQLTYILEGVLRFWLGEDEAQTVDVAAGEVLHIPSFLAHRAEALERTLDVDIFCPPRQDWLDGSDAYLRARGPGPR
jgi:unsaturated pyranuronate lyase